MVQNVILHSNYKHKDGKIYRLQELNNGKAFLSLVGLVSEIPIIKSEYTFKEEFTLFQRRCPNEY